MDIKGVFTKEIADVSIVPTSISLAGNANFIEFEGKKKDVKISEECVNTMDSIYSNYTLTILASGRIPKENSAPAENISYFEIKSTDNQIAYSFEDKYAETNKHENAIKFNASWSSVETDTIASSLHEAIIKNCPLLTEQFDISILNKNTSSINFQLKRKYKNIELIFKEYDPRFLKIEKEETKVEVSRYNVVDTNSIDLLLKVNPIKDVSASGNPTFSIIINKIKYVFSGTTDKTKINSSTFLYDENNSTTAENIKSCFESNSFFKNTFSITVPPIFGENGMLKSGDTIHLKSYNENQLYSLSIEDYELFDISSNLKKEQEQDLLQGSDTDCQIELDVYTDTGIRLGEHDIDENKTILGTYLTTQTKAYSGQPIWFDLNSVPTNIRIHSNQLPENGLWSNPETVRDFRYIAKRNNGYNRETFFVSDVFYAVNGHCRSLDENNLDEYIYDPTKGEEAKLLTKQPSLFHIKGQVQFLNFLLSKPKGFEDDTIGVMYHLKSQSGAYIAREEFHKERLRNLNSINSIRLDIDTLLDKWEDKDKTTGQVEIYLARNGERMSQSINFTILPDYLYKINDFAFLNSLGGWNSFNFAGTNQTEFKSKASTISKTQTPKSSPKEMLRSEIESVFAREVEEYFTAQTMPINATTTEWLKEMSASTAVYEISSDRYIIIDDMDIKHSSKDDLVTVQMKYHYSDSYN